MDMRLVEGSLGDGTVLEDVSSALPLLLPSENSGIVARGEGYWVILYTRFRRKTTGAWRSWLQGGKEWLYSARRRHQYWPEKDSLQH